MIRRSIVTGPLALLILVFAAACSVLQAPEEASGPIEAIPLEVASEEQQPAAQSEESEQAEEATGDETTASEETASGGVILFQINPDASQVRFELDEDLRGQRKTVVGTSNQVAGEIALDKGDLSTTQVGSIRINARTLATDNDFRNRAIQNRILVTDDHEFITFTPTAVNGLPDSADLGDTVNFTLVGDLTIRDITNEVTFDVEVTLTSETELTGTASTLVSRADYDLQIPSVPNVANVEEEIELFIDFVANSA